MLVAFDSAVAGADPSAFAEAIANRLKLNQSCLNLKLKQTNEQTICLDQARSIEAQLWLEFEIEPQPPSWIAFCLSEKGLDRWLQHLQTQPPPSNTTQTIATGHSSQSLVAPPAAIDVHTVEMLWQAQYTYACCARLLRKCAASSAPTPAPAAKLRR